MNLASPFWQGIIFLFSALFLCWEIWGGWRRGVLRSALHFSAFIFSGILGILAGQASVFVVEKILPGYGFLAGVLVGILVTLLILGLTLLLGAILFKRTAQQSSSLLRLFYGGGGAFFGLLTGLVFLWGGITLIRIAGTATQIIINSRPAEPIPPLANATLTLKESLELGPAGKLVESLDVIPPEIYNMLARIDQLTSQEEAMMRFLDYPGVQQIMQNPQVSALFKDPSITLAIEQKNIFSLMQNKALFAALQDPALQNQLKGLDLKKALDYALPPKKNSQSFEENP